MTICSCGLSNCMNPTQPWLAVIAATSGLPPVAAGGRGLAGAAHRTDGTAATPRGDLGPGNVVPVRRSCGTGDCRRRALEDLRGVRRVVAQVVAGRGAGCPLFVRMTVGLDLPVALVVEPCRRNSGRLADSPPIPPGFSIGKSRTAAHCDPGLPNLPLPGCASLGVRPPACVFARHADGVEG
jgi:hypothetical protein